MFLIYNLAHARLALILFKLFFNLVLMPTNFKQINNSYCYSELEKRLIK